MPENSKIEWCDHSWSPWRGCTKVSPGCANCYAETLSHRNPAVLGQWGKGKPRVLAKNWKNPAKWNQSKICTNCGEVNWFGVMVCREISCAHFEFHRPRVFPSLCDWLDDEVPIEWLAQFLQLIHDTPNIDWLLLTKRPELWNVRKWAVESRIVRNMKSACDKEVGKASYSKVREQWSDRSRWFSDWVRGDYPSNVWIGTSVEDQARADERIPALIDIPAKLRFLSVEPLLGPVDLRYSAFNGVDSSAGMHGIDWVIVGGESGPLSRPCNIEWIRSIVRQCVVAGVPCFVKQLGSKCMTAQLKWFLDGGREVSHPKGGDPSE